MPGRVGDAFPQEVLRCFYVLFRVQLTTRNRMSKRTIIMNRMCCLLKNKRHAMVSIVMSWLRGTIKTVTPAQSTPTPAFEGRSPRYVH